MNLIIRELCNCNILRYSDKPELAQKEAAYQKTRSRSKVPLQSVESVRAAQPEAMNMLGRSRTKPLGRMKGRAEETTDTDSDGGAKSESPVKIATTPTTDRFRGVAWSNMRVEDLQGKAEGIYSTFIRDIIGAF